MRQSSRRHSRDPAHARTVSPPLPHVKAINVYVTGVRQEFLAGPVFVVTPSEAEGSRCAKGWTATTGAGFLDSLRSLEMTGSWRSPGIRCAAGRETCRAPALSAPWTLLLARWVRRPTAHSIEWRCSAIPALAFRSGRARIDS